MSARRRSGARVPTMRRQRGFTLIEIVVAFALLALGLTLLLGTLSGASRQLRQAGDAGQAALHAQSLLAERSDALLQPGQLDGSFEQGRYRWHLAVTPWQEPQARAAAADPFAARLLHLRLDVRWGDGGPQQQLQVNSLRLVLPTAADGVRP